MAEKYDISNYTRVSLPASYSADVRQMVGAAVSLGWTLHVAKNQNVQLISYDGSKTISLSPRKKSQPTRSLKQTLSRYANPLLAVDMRKVDERAHQIENSIITRTNTMAVEAFGAKDMVEAAKKAEEFVMEHKSPDQTVVYEGPMRSKGANGQGYESDIADEIEYASGVSIKTCRRCGWQTEKSPRAMGAHWQAHVNQDKSAKGGHTGPSVTLSQQGDYRPTQERLDSLTDTLKSMIEAGGVDWSNVDNAAQAMALAALTWDHDRRMTGGEREPLTDAQVLDRIRRLVDGGRYEERLEEIRSLNERVSEAEARISEIMVERDKARGDLRTLRELIDGLGE